jgi:hypothetical protein
MSTTDTFLHDLMIDGEIRCNGEPVQWAKMLVEHPRHLIQGDFAAILGGKVSDS